MRSVTSSSLKCFSPPVMIATFAIEIILAVYVTAKYKLNSVTRPAVAMLFFLAVFQLAEYNVCEGAFGVDSLSWSRLGYVAITTLPPLGIHMAVRMAGERQRALIAGSYLVGALFAGYFLFSGFGITSQACLGNYVIFEVAPGSVLPYTLYYYGLLFVGVYYCITRAHKVALHKAAALRALAVGYAVLLIPTTLANIIDPKTMAGIPSIMCGFAVFLALILAGEILPHYFKQPSFSKMMKQRSGAHGKASR